MENAEINNIIKIVGLQYKKSYEDPESLKSLRYGKIMIMTDQVSLKFTTLYIYSISWNVFCCSLTVDSVFVHYNLPLCYDNIDVFRGNP